MLFFMNQFPSIPYFLGAFFQGLKDRFCIQFFRPRTHPRTFLQCFALDSHCSKAKHCRNVLGRVLGRKNQIQNQSFSMLTLNNVRISAFQSVIKDGALSCGWLTSQQVIDPVTGFNFPIVLLNSSCIRQGHKQGDI